MFLNDVATLESSQKFQRLNKTLKRDHGVDITPYYDLTESELEQFITDLKIKASEIILESDFGDQYQDPEYVRATLLSEACRMILKEIHPKRSKRDKVDESQVDETLDFKIDEPTGVAVDHVTGDYEAESEEESKERPDLYWRRQQWKEEQKNEHPAVVAVDDDGEHSPLGNSETHYAVNHEGDPTRTPEDEQEAGVYVGVMDPNRFLGNDEQGAIHVSTSSGPDGFGEPKLTDVVTSSPDDGKLGDVQIDGEREGIALKKIIAVYEDNEDMQTQMEKLGKLLENTLLQEGELERAEIVMAMRDISNRIQKQLEDAGKMATDDIMPLTDGLRTYYSDAAADNFAMKAEEGLQRTIDSLQSMKDLFEEQSSELEQRISDEDSTAPMNDMMDAGGDDFAAELGNELGADNAVAGGDEFGNDLEAALGGEEPELDDVSIEPLGRAKKESIENKNAVIVELAGRKVRITEHQLASIVFAKKFYEKTSMMGARSVRVSESQNVMLESAKRIMKKLNEGKK